MSGVQGGEDASGEQAPVPSENSIRGRRLRSVTLAHSGREPRGRYAELLRAAADDLRAAAIATGHTREVIESWGPLPVATVLATGERLLRQCADRPKD